MSTVVSLPCRQRLQRDARRRQRRAGTIGNDSANGGGRGRNGEGYRRKKYNNAKRSHAKLHRAACAPGNDGYLPTRTVRKLDRELAAKRRRARREMPGVRRQGAAARRGENRDVAYRIAGERRRAAQQSSEEPKADAERGGRNELQDRGRHGLRQRERIEIGSADRTATAGPWRSGASTQIAMPLRPQIDEPPRRTPTSAATSRRGRNPPKHQPRIFQPAGGDLGRKQPGVKSGQRQRPRVQAMSGSSAPQAFRHSIPSWHFACNAQVRRQ